MVIPKDSAPLNAPCLHVVQHMRGIKSFLPRHNHLPSIICKNWQRPPIPVLFKAEGKNAEMSYTGEKREEQIYHRADEVGIEAGS